VPILGTFSAKPARDPQENQRGDRLRWGQVAAFRT
jgi:hypothetical protein